MQVGSWCCGEYGDQLFIEIEEDESLNVSTEILLDLCSVNGHL